MNILLASDANVERAGVCIFMFRWIQGILEMDKDIHVTAYFRKGIKDEHFADQYRAMGVELVLGELPQDQTSLSGTNRNKVRSDIRKILKSKPFEIIHINSSAVGFSTMILTEGLRAGVPKRILHSHGRNPGNGIKNAYLWAFKLINRTIATKWAGCSVDAGQYLFGRHAEESRKWVFIPNTIPADEYAFDEENRKRKRESLGIDEEVLLLGAAGMLTDLKNHQFLFPVVKTLNETGLKSKLIIFGDGEKREELTRYAKDLGLGKDIILYGTTDEIARWLSALDIYVMPSLSEGLPLSAVEAQANGLCCLLSDHIARDVDLCPDVYHLPIDQGADGWVETIKKQRKKSAAERRQGVQRIKDAGFDRESIREYISRLYEISV